jgi:hypothetical protein
LGGRLVLKKQSMAAGAAAAATEVSQEMSFSARVAHEGVLMLAWGKS